MGERLKVSIKHVRTMLLVNNLVNIRRTEIKQQGENMVHGTVKGIQREGMTRSEEGVINSFDIFKASRVERRRCMQKVFILVHCINFHSLFQLCPTYFLSVNALPARKSQLLWELQRSQLLQKLVKITFLHTYLWYQDTLVPKQSKSLRLEIVQMTVFAGLRPFKCTSIMFIMNSNSLYYTGEKKIYDV